MSELLTISDGGLDVVVNRRGGELWSVQLDGHEYLWDGNPVYWPDRGFHMFPYIARLTDRTYTLDGTAYFMDIHGFLKDRDLEIISKQPDSLLLGLHSDEDTVAQYPFHFDFQLSLGVKKQTLTMGYQVHNRSTGDMYFGLGGHPGIRVPLESHLAFEDYQVRFIQPCQPIRTRFSEDYFVTGEAPFPLEGGQVLPLRHNLFDQDVIVLKGTPGQISLQAPKGNRGVTMSYAGFRYLGLWHQPGTDAPYVCIEPWSSLPSRKGVVEEFRTQPDLVRLPSGETYHAEWSLSVF